MLLRTEIVTLNVRIRRKRIVDIQRERMLPIGRQIRLIKKQIIFSYYAKKKDIGKKSMEGHRKTG